MPPVTHDRFAHLRTQLATFRTATTGIDAIAWCVACEMHHAAQVGGLCPVCLSDQEHIAA